MPNAAARILDANANRAREALRTMEDIARFALNNRALSSEFKSIRHELRNILDALPAQWLHANRDTPNDVGTAISTDTETQRRNLYDVAIAAGKRLGESLRVMEETSKILNPQMASRLESLRYRAYSAEAALAVQLRGGCATQWRLCILLTLSLCKQPWREVLRAAIDHGADCIQVREKDMSGDDLVRHVEAVIDIARKAGVSVIVNDRVDVAMAAGADGVHLGTSDLPISHVRSITGRSLVIGASTHDLDEADSAAAAGADYCGVGAMFNTSLKPQRTPSGTAYLREYLARYPHLPHLAIGGITPDNIAQLVAAGARSVAVSSCVCSAENPGEVVQQLVKALTQPLTQSR